VYSTKPCIQSWEPLCRIQTFEWYRMLIEAHCRCSEHAQTMHIFRNSVAHVKGAKELP
jgi:hypothetical protein